MKMSVKYEYILEIVDKMPTTFSGVFEKFMGDLTKVIPELSKECEHLLRDLSENPVEFRRMILESLTSNGADEKLAMRDEE